MKEKTSLTKHLQTLIFPFPSPDGKQGDLHVEAAARFGYSLCWRCCQFMFWGFDRCQIFLSFFLLDSVLLPKCFFPIRAVRNHDEWIPFAEDCFICCDSAAFLCSADCKTFLRPKTKDVGGLRRLPANVNGFSTLTCRGSLQLCSPDLMSPCTDQ